MDQRELRDRIQSILEIFPAEIDIALGVKGEEQDELVLQLKAATTVGECWNVFYQCPDDSGMRQWALEKILDLTTIIGECRTVFRWCEFHSPLAHRAIRKIAELLQKESATV